MNITEYWLALPQQPFSESTPVYSDAYQTWCLGSDAVNDLCQEHACSIDDLRLVVGEPLPLNAIIESAIKPDADVTLPPEVAKALTALNAAIEQFNATQPPICWCVGRSRPVFNKQCPTCNGAGQQHAHHNTGPDSTTGKTCRA